MNPLASLLAAALAATAVFICDPTSSSSAKVSSTNTSAAPPVNAEIWAVPASLLPLLANQSLVIHDEISAANGTKATTDCCGQCSRECCSGLGEVCCGAFVNATLACVCC